MKRETKHQSRFFMALLLVAGWVSVAGAIMADPPPSEEGEIEIEMDGLHGGGESKEQARSAALAALCLLVAKDDHGDFEPCATWLAPGRELVAMLGDSSGLDRDVFLVRVGDPGNARRHSMELVLAAELELDLRLRAADGAYFEPEKQQVVGPGSVARFQGLPSGTYYLEVTSKAGGVGLYALRLAPLSE